MPVASEQIEEILRLNRDESEREISRYRVFLFAVGLLIGFATLAAPSVNWVPIAHWCVCLVYAWVIRRLVLRHGAKPVLVVTSVVLDLLAMASVFGISTLVGAEVIDVARWTSYVLPAMLFIVLLVNSLRASRKIAVLASMLSAVLFFAVTGHFDDSAHLQQGVTAVIFMASSWIGMKAADRTRQALERFARFQLLRRYLPSAAVERVLTENPDDALALGGDLLTVTILAADLRGFTAMSEKLSPAEVVQQLNAYHGAMLDVVERHGGMLDKFIGDGALVVFGLERAIPVKLKDAGASAAVACARDMLTALEGLNARRAEAGMVPLRMGVGIHTGPVVAGNIGAPGRRIEFTVVGDTVNTASRLEGLTKEVGHPVVLSRATAQQLQSLEGLVALEPVKVKGKDEPIHLFAPVLPASPRAGLSQ